MTQDFHPYRSAKEAAEQQEPLGATPQTRSPSYRLAFTDQQFLLREELRPVRLQLELLKPEMLQQEQNVVSTVVVFGSARTPDLNKAKAAMQQAEKNLKEDPDNEAFQLAHKRAKIMMEHAGYYEEARKFARLVSNYNLNTGRSEFVVTTGGGPGIMEAANRGAYEVGSKSCGLAIALPKEELPNQYVTPELSFHFHYFAIRKMHFLMRAIAMVAFPGGFGTFDELFEALTLMQTGRIQRMPMVLVGKRFWERVVNFHALVEEGVISPGDLELLHSVETAEEAWQYVADWYNLDLQDEAM